MTSLRSHRFTQARVLQPRLLLLALTALLAVSLGACSNTFFGGGGGDGPGGGGGSDVPGGNPNPAYEPMETFNSTARETSGHVQELHQAVAGPRGLETIISEMEALNLREPADQQRWAQLDTEFEAQFARVERAVAAATLHAVELADQEAAIAQMRRNALAGLDGVPMGQPKVIGTVIVVSSVAIGLARVYRSFRDLSYKHQNAPVRRVATSSEGGRQVIREALARQGVTTPDGISGEELADLFERQTDRNLRAHVTSSARDFNLVNSADANSPDHELAVAAMEDRIQENAQAARECGVVATDAVVSLSQAGPSGSTGLDATMLILDATETNPQDFVRRHVDAVVASQEKEAIPPTTSTLPGDEARARLRQAAQGETQPTPDEADEFTQAIIHSIRSEVEQDAPLNAAPVRIAMGSTTLEEEPENPGNFRASLDLPGFNDGDLADLLIVREDARPVEGEGHPVGPYTPFSLQHTPLLGTLSLSAIPLGPAVDDERTWEVEVMIRRVPEATQIVMSGVNVSATPRILDAWGDERFVVLVDAYGNATVQARRLDTGESYLMSLTSEEDQDLCQGVGTFACGDGTVICADLVCNGTHNCADGSDEDSDMCGNEETCCVATNGCPGETATSCADTCCCCPYGEMCDQSNPRNGCVRVSGY